LPTSPKPWAKEGYLSLVTKKMERLKIGLDLDGVVADSAPAVVSAIYKHFRPGQPYEERFGLSVHAEELKIPVETILEFVTSLLVTEEFYQKLKPVRGAVKGVDKLCRIGEIHLLSHRPQTVKDPFDISNLTLGWLRKWDLHSKIVSLSLNPSHLDRDFKVNQAKERNFDLYIDDELEEAEKFWDIGLKVVLFNLQNDHFSLSKEVAVAHSWPKIVSAVEKFSGV